MSLIQLNFLGKRVTGESGNRDSVLKLRGGGILVFSFQHSSLWVLQAVQGRAESLIPHL